MSGVRTDIWEGVEHLVDSADNLSDLWAHRIHLFAARRWRELDREVPAELVTAEQRAAVAAVSASALLERIRVAYDGPILLFKGPEAARHYPDPTLRSYIDIDLLVPEAEDAQRALVGAGFVEAEDPPWSFRLAHPGVDLFVERHHLRPLRWPGLPLRVELHRRPSWPRWMDSPFVESNEELFAVATESVESPDGILALPRAHHALVLAAHSWVHSPLGRLRDLVDVAAVSEGVDPRELDQIARDWGMARLWQTTIAAVEAVILGGGGDTFARRTWARNLQNVRERTVFEAHVERWASCFWALPARRAMRVAASNVASDLRPAAGEPWGAKIGRMGLATRNAFMRKSKHDAELGPEARQLRR